MRHLISKLQSFALFAFFVSTSSAAPSISWEWINPLPQGNILSGVACDGTRYVAVGHQGTILLSSDTVKWTPVDSGVIRNLNAIAYGHGQFVAVGDGGTLLTSADGMTWNKQTGSSAKNLYGITFANDLFVAVGGDNNSSSELATSPDGVTWTHIAVPSSNGLNSVAYGNNVFVAVGRNSPFLTSPDGKTWTRVVWTADLQGPFYGVCFGQGAFVTVGASGAVATSSDGQTWSVQNISDLDLSAIAFGDAGFTLVGRSGAIGESHDGSLWSQDDGGTLLSFFGIATCGMVRVAVGNEGAIAVNTSIAWTNRGTTVAGGNEAIASGNGTLVAVGYKVASDTSIIGSIITSHDKKAWTEHDGGPKSLDALVFATGKFVAVGDSGNIRTSPDGDSWKDVSPGVEDNLLGLAYGSGIFVAVGQGPLSGFTFPAAVLTSPDGVTWTEQASPDTNFLYCVTYGNGLFVAGGIGGIMTSSDGVNWTKRSIPVSSEILGLGYGAGMFVAVGADTLFTAARLFTSTNGINWVTRSSGVSTPLKAVAFGDGTFVAVGGDEQQADRYFKLSSSITASSDGVNWTRQNDPTDASGQGVVFTDGAFYIAGLRRSVLGSVTASPSRPVLGGSTNPSGFQLTIQADPGTSYRLQSSQDLHLWTDLATLTNNAASSSYVDTSSSGKQWNFYRTVAP